MNNQNDQQQDRREYAKGIRIICVYLEEFVKFKGSSFKSVGSRLLAA